MERVDDDAVATEHAHEREMLVDDDAVLVLTRLGHPVVLAQPLARRRALALANWQAKRVTVNLAMQQ